MFTFTQTINIYDDDRGFYVTYRPDDSRLSVIHLWIKLPPLVDTNEILQQLSNAAPQHEWQRQIDALSVDTSIYQSLVGTETRVEEPTIIRVPDPFDSNTINQVKSRII